MTGRPPAPPRPPGPPGPPAPAAASDWADRIDRGALERILQRATELQAAEHDIGEGLTSDEVLALGKEVGIPPIYLRQAMLEEKSRVSAPASAGFWDGLVGPPEVTAVRVVHGDQAAVERALLGWMEKNELLVVQRQQPGRITWERLSGMQAALRRGMATFETARARFMLARADTVRAAITALEPGYCHVALTASLREARGGHVGGSAGFVTVGFIGSGVLLVLGALPLVAFAPVPLGLGLAWTITRRYRPVAERVQLGLERALDHVEGIGIRPTHELPPRTMGILNMIAGEVRKALSSVPKAPDRPKSR